MFRYYKILFSEFIGIACSSTAKLLKLPFIVRVNLFEGLRRVSGIFRGDTRLKRYSTHASLAMSIIVCIESGCRSFADDDDLSLLAPLEAMRASIQICLRKVFSEVRSKHKHGARILSDPKPASGPPLLEWLTFSQILVDVPKQNPCYEQKLPQIERPPFLTANLSSEFLPIRTATTRT
jgi:hypothetical protein